MKNKEKIWKYTTYIFMIISVSLLVVSVLYDPASGIDFNNIEEKGSGSYSSFIEVPVSNVNSNPNVLPFDILLTGTPYYTQDEVTNLLVIGNTPNGFAEWGQEIKFSNNEKVNGFYTLIGRKGMPSQPLYLAITNADCSVFKGVAEISASELPKSIDDGVLYWVGWEFPDDPFPASTRVFIYAGSDNQYDSNKLWLLGCSANNPFSNGKLYIMKSNGWVCDDDNVDSAFKIYIESSSPPPAQPVISISITATIATAGFLCMLGGALSAIKYISIIGWV